MQPCSLVPLTTLLLSPPFVTSFPSLTQELLQFPFIARTRMYSLRIDPRRELHELGINAGQRLPGYVRSVFAARRMRSVSPVRCLWYLKLPVHISDAATRLITRAAPLL